MKARLVQSNEGFNLFCLDEVRFFYKCLGGDALVLVVDDEGWSAAVRQLRNNYSESANLETCLRLISDFEAVNPSKMYISDFKAFAQESHLEDFIGDFGETIIVSTMHKAKGREFDNVFLLPGNQIPQSDEEKRVLYVAMTRAKNQLSIHLKGSWLDNLVSVDGLKVYSDTRMWQMPEMLTVQLTHRDVWLNYYRNKQREISGIKAGDILRVDGYECCNTEGNVLLKFSRGFQDFINDLNQKGYQPFEAMVNFVVWWKKEDDAKEIKILLPQICFEYKKSGNITAV